MEGMVLQQMPGLAEYEHPFQGGQIGLWQALLGYDPQRGYQFSTYACIAIRNQVRRGVLRSLKVYGWQRMEAEKNGAGIKKQVNCFSSRPVNQHHTGERQ